MKCGLRYGLIFLTYSFSIICVINIYYNTKEEYRLHHEQIENADLDCTPVYEGSPEAQHYKVWQLNSGYIQEQLEDQDEICSTLHKFFYFQNTPRSMEEKEFPLAFGFQVHVDVIQVLLTLSILYQPQNQYCLTIDNRSSDKFKNVLMKIPRCFENVRVQIGDQSYPPEFKMGVLDNVYQCVTDLAGSGSKWEYYQFVAAHDVPLKTNLEMVRILKALNGSINTEIRQYASWRYGIRRSDVPPFALYQGGMGVALPRAAVEHLVMKRDTDFLLNYLSKTHMPYETFWATIASNKRDLKTPGSFYGEDLLYLQKKYKHIQPDIQLQTPENIGKTVITRLEVSSAKPHCAENELCMFDIDDIPFLLSRPELLAHKIFMTVQPAAYICLVKELRRRSLDPDSFDAIRYSHMPTVELHRGIKMEHLTHPEWMAAGWKFEKFA